MKGVLKCIFLSFALSFVMCDESDTNETSKRIVQYRNCKSAFEIKKVEVSPCEINPEPGRVAVRFCPVVRNSTSSISVTFVPNRDVKKMEAKVRARMDGVEYPYPLPQPDVCHKLGCPLQAGTTYTYTESINILPIYPKKTLIVIWSLNDKSNDEMEAQKKTEVCFIFMTKVTDADAIAAFRRRQENF